MSVFGGKDSDKDAKDYTWEIKGIDDANEWIENIEMDSMFHFNEIKNSKGLVYQLLDQSNIPTFSRDLSSLMHGLTYLVHEFKEDNEGVNRITPYKVLTKAQAELKSNRIIKDLDSANLWLADIGYEGAIRFNVNNIDYDKRIYWKIEVLINNEWKQQGRIAEYTKIIKLINYLITPKVEIPEIEAGRVIRSIKEINDWLDTIDFKGSGGRRPYIFKKKSENNNIYSVWDIYKNGGETETKLEFISTSLEISLAYIVITRKLKDYLWDVQLKKESVKKGLNITISSLEAANKWIASLGYKNHLRFNCKERVQNTPNGKVRFPVYFLQERLSGDNWKIVNNTFGKFDDILCLFCKLTKRYKEVPKCTIEFRPQLVEEQKMSEIIQSVKGANIWFDKINIQGCKFRIKSREDKQNKRLYTIEFMNPQGQIGKFYECASLKESILYFCKCYQIKAPAVANM